MFKIKITSKDIVKLEDFFLMNDRVYKVVKIDKGDLWLAWWSMEKKEIEVTGGGDYRHGIHLDWFYGKIRDGVFKRIFPDHLLKCSFLYSFKIEFLKDVNIQYQTKN